MKKQITKLGFTLIELLVVITIIGILATGATAIYTSQIQKARDSNRVTDIKALQTSVEQIYADMSEYPSVTNNTDYSDTAADACAPGDSNNNLSCLLQLGYIPAFPQDKKNGSPGAGSALVYLYNVADSDSGVDNQLYELSVGFEAKGSLASKAVQKVDNGADDVRMEVGNPSVGISTSLDGCASLGSDGESQQNTSACDMTDKKLLQLDGSNGITNTNPVVVMRD